MRRGPPFWKSKKRSKKSCPNFPRSERLFHLAITWIQLGRGREALEVLEKYHKLDANDAVVEYYLCALCMERLDYNRSWYFLKQAESITRARDHKPKALKETRMHLRRFCPESAP